MVSGRALLIPSWGCGLCRNSGLERALRSLPAGLYYAQNTPMRAFLSHSSTDKEIVIAVHNGLEQGSTWLDRGEIEWGALFLERIADGIASATDFVLFWSAAAAASEWVRIGLNMAF